MKALIALIAIATLSGCVSSPSKPYTTQAQDHWQTTKDMYASLPDDIKSCSGNQPQLYSLCVKKKVGALLILMDQNPNMFADEYRQVDDIMAKVDMSDINSVYGARNQIRALIRSMQPEMNAVIQSYEQRARAAHSREYARTMEELKGRQIQAAQIAQQRASQPQTTYVRQPSYSSAASAMVMGNMPRPGFNPAANSRSKSSSFIVQRNSGNRLVHCTTGYCF